MKIKIRKMGQREPLSMHQLKNEEQIELEWPDGTRLVISQPSSGSDRNSSDKDYIDLRSVGGPSNQITVSSVAGNRIEIGVR